MQQHRMVPYATTICYALIIASEKDQQAAPPLKVFKVVQRQGMAPDAIISDT